MRNTRPVRATLRVTAEEFCRALYGVGADAANAGVYPDTDIPLRSIPADAMLTVTDCGVVRVSDDDCGWIADRLCDGVIGRRQWCKLVAAGLGESDG